MSKEEDNRTSENESTSGDTGSLSSSTGAIVKEAVSQTKAMANNIKIEPPTAFDFHTPSEWKKWIRRFERFRVASGLVDRNEKEQVNLLIYSMGEKADDFLVASN